MKFNKALLSLAVAGALATPIAANAAAKIVVNDTTVGLPANLYTTANNTAQIAAGIKATATTYKASDDVTVDAVYVTPDNSPVNVRPISFNGPMPASARTTVSVAYSTDVQLPDEGTLRFQIGGVAGGFNASTANTVKLIAQVVQTDIAYTAAAAEAIGDTAVSATKPTTAVGTFAAATGKFVEVGQSFDYADTDGDQDVDYITVQIATDDAALNGLAFALDGYTQQHSVAAVDWVLKDLGADKTEGTADDIWEIAYVDAKGNKVAVSSDVSAAFVPGEALPRRTQLYLAQPNGTDYSPVDFVVSEGSKAGDNITVSIPEAKNTAGVDINAAIAGETVAVTINNGLALDVEEATSQIDVEATAGSRTQFVAESTVGLGDTDLDTSRAEVQLVNGADYGITLDAGDTFSITLQRKDGENTDAVESVTLGALALTETPAGSGVWAATGVDFAGGLNLLVSQELEIVVDEETILYPNITDALDWVATVTVTDDGADAGEVTGGTYVVPVGDNQDGLTHTWTINGLQAKIPYIYNINADNWSSVVKIVNESANEANVSAKVILGELGNKASSVLMSGAYQTAVNAEGRNAGGYEFNIESLGYVPAKGHLTFDGKHIIDTLGLDSSVNYHIEVELLVEAAQNKVHVAAQNKNPEGRADAPVLYFINQVEDRSCDYVDTNDSTTTPDTKDPALQTYVCTSRTVDGRQWQ
jgi:hypothetical protein